MTRYLIGIPAILAIGSLIISMLLATLLWLTYSNLTKENLVSIITFDKVEAKENLYTAHVFSPQGDEIGDYLIYGDQWRLDAAFIKMKYWANVLGVDSKYALNRIEGRYENIQDENNKTHKSYQLESHNIINLFSFFVDVSYGSSVYQNIELGIKYCVLHSPTGLLVRQEPIIHEKSFLDEIQELLGV